MKLKSHRQTMLKLNSRVHSWVTRQENEFKLQQSLAPTTSTGSAAAAAVDTATSQSMVADQLTVDLGGAVVPSKSGSVSVGIVMDKGALDQELQVRLKGDVSDLYNCWDEAEAR